MALHTGWGKGKKEEHPFSKQEFEKSHIKKNIRGLSYKRYLTEYATLPLHKHKKKRIVKRVVRRRPRSQFGFGFRF